MKKIFLLFTLSFCFNVFANVSCKKHPIYCQIKKNKPSLKHKYAMKLSNVIYKMHKKYKIPTRIFTAILMQESGYSLGAKGCHGGLVVPKCNQLEGPESIRFKCKLKTKEFTYETKVCSDFGISQIYYKTAKRFGFNIFKLNNDLEYSVEAGAIVLGDFMKKYKRKDEDWWVRYNCGVRGSTNRDTCVIYKNLVKRYM